MPIKKTKKPQPQVGGSSVKFTVVLSHSDFEILDREAHEGLNWRQLSQKVLREFAAEVRNREALAEADAVSA